MNQTLIAKQHTKMKLEKKCLEAVASQLLPFNTRPPEPTYETPYFLHSGGPEITNNFKKYKYL